MKSAARCLFCLVVSFAAWPMVAQELPIFELDSFVDPRTLGTDLSEGKVIPGLRFLSLRASAGWISDFQQRNTLSGQELGFLHADLNFYSGRSQWGLSVSRIDGDEVREVPEAESLQMEFLPAELLEEGTEPLQMDRAAGLAFNRVQVRYGHYSLVESTLEEPTLEESALEERRVESASRYMVSWYVQDRAKVVPGRGIEREFDVHGLLLAFDVAGIVEGLGGEEQEDGFYGGFIVAAEHVPGRSTDYRLSYLYQGLFWDRGGLQRLSWRGGFSGERTFNHWRWGTARFELTYRLSLRPLRTNLHFVVAPAYRFPSQGIEKEWQTELAVFLDAAVLSRLF